MENDTIQTDSVNMPEHQQKADKKSVKINKKMIIICAVIIVVVVFAYVYKGLLIAATVNGSPISRFAVIQTLEKSSGKSLLDSLIVEKLIQDAANAKNISISNDEINAEIKKIEDSLSAQGGTIDAALAAQGMSLEDLKKQIVLQKEVEKLLADKVTVTDEDVAQYIKDNQVTIPEGQEATTTAQIKSELVGQKTDTETQALITDLKAKANIQYFVKY